MPQSQIQSEGPRQSIFVTSARIDGQQNFLVIQNEEQRRIKIKRFPYKCSSLICLFSFNATATDKARDLSVRKKKQAVYSHKVLFLSSSVHHRSILKQKIPQILSLNSIIKSSFPIIMKRKQSFNFSKLPLISQILLNLGDCDIPAFAIQISNQYQHPSHISPKNSSKIPLAQQSLKHLMLYCRRDCIQSDPIMNFSNTRVSSIIKLHHSLTPKAFPQCTEMLNFDIFVVKKIQDCPQIHRNVAHPLHSLLRIVSIISLIYCLACPRNFQTNIQQKHQLFSAENTQTVEVSFIEHSFRQDRYFRTNQAQNKVNKFSSHYFLIQEVYQYLELSNQDDPYKNEILKQKTTQKQVIASQWQKYGMSLIRNQQRLRREQPQDSMQSTQDDPYKNEILKLKNTQQPRIIGQRYESMASLTLEKQQADLSTQSDISLSQRNRTYIPLIRNYLKKQEQISQTFSAHFQQNYQDKNPLIIAQEDLREAVKSTSSGGSQYKYRTPFVDRKTKSTYRKDMR
ncbi:hypothetical protein ABPG72_022013 [Tetrahymena utriculariae]